MGNSSQSGGAFKKDGAALDTKDQLFHVLLIGDTSSRTHYLLRSNIQTTSDIFGIIKKVNIVEYGADKVQIELKIESITDSEVQWSPIIAELAGHGRLGAVFGLFVFNVMDHDSFEFIQSQIEGFDARIKGAQSLLIGHLLDTEKEIYDEEKRVIPFQDGQALSMKHDMLFKEVQSNMVDDVDRMWMDVALRIYHSVKQIDNEVIHKPLKVMSHEVDQKEERTETPGADTENIKGTKPLKRIKRKKSRIQRLKRFSTRRRRQKKEEMKEMDANDKMEDNVEDRNVMQSVRIEEEREIATNPVQQLHKFLMDIGMEECFDSFRSTGCDISYIEDFDDETLVNDIGIKSSLKRKKFLRECRKFREEMKEFDDILKAQKVSMLTSRRLKKFGIITLHILMEEVIQRSDLRDMYQIESEAQCNVLWNIIQSETNPARSNDSNHNANDLEPGSLIDEGVDILCQEGAETPYL